MSVDAEKYSCRPTPSVRAGLACLGAALGASGALICRTPLEGALWLAIVFLALTWSACDVRARLLPASLTVAFAAVSAAWQFETAGTHGLLVALAIAAGCFCIFGGTSLLLSFMGKENEFGKGDLKLVGPVALCCGWPGFAYGVAAMTVATLAYFAYKAARKELSIDMPLPFGPLLAVFALAGAAGGVLAY